MILPVARLDFLLVPSAVGHQPRMFRLGLLGPSQRTERLRGSSLRDEQKL